MTPFRALNEMTGGSRGGELWIIAGRPGMGKTSLALSIADHASEQVPVCLFSLEMSAVELEQRLFAKRADVNLQYIRTGRLKKDEFDSVVSIAGPLAENYFFVDDSSTVSPLQLKSKVREWAVTKKLTPGLVIVDYIQLMSPGRRFDSREREVASISRELKGIAKDLQVPVVVLSQLNRKLEDRRDKRPILADLRESGAIEQDADVVAAVYQPFPYTGQDEDRGKAELILLKQRNGAIGVVPLRWHPETASFSDVP